MPSPRRVPRTAWVLALLTVLVAAVGLAAIGLRGAPGADAMQVVVSPHPDDELQGWAALTAHDDAFTVFVVMTRGEATGNCDGAPGLQARWGERPPEPIPEQPGTHACGAARIDSWHHFLDAAAPTIGSGDALATMDPVPAMGEGPALWVGQDTARVVFDAGDGDVQPAEVTAAVRTVLDLRGGVLPELPVARLIATAYVNDSPQRGENVRAHGCSASHPCPGSPEFVEYEHLDHVAVNDGVAAVAGLARYGAWLVTHPDDPAARTTRALTPTTYQALMGLGEPLGEGPASRQRTGAHQVAYGWLAFPGPYWATGALPTAEGDVLFPRIQTYRHVPG